MKARVMYIAAATFAAAALVLPLWGFSMSAPQYPDETLHLRVARTGIAGDVHEVETLQHYIGVRFPTDVPRRTNGLPVAGKPPTAPVLVPCVSVSKAN